MKLELEFDITKIEDNSVEGTWRMSDKRHRGMMQEFIARHITTDDAIMEKWGMDSPLAHERMTRDSCVSLYTEDGEFFSDGVRSGVFRATHPYWPPWRD